MNTESLQQKGFAVLLLLLLERFYLSVAIRCNDSLSWSSAWIHRQVALLLRIPTTAVNRYF